MVKRINRGHADAPSFEEVIDGHQVPVIPDTFLTVEKIYRTVKNPEFTLKTEE